MKYLISNAIFTFQGTNTNNKFPLREDRCYSSEDACEYWGQISVYCIVTEIIDTELHSYSIQSDDIPVVSCVHPGYKTPRLHPDCNEGSERLCALREAGDLLSTLPTCCGISVIVKFLMQWVSRLHVTQPRAGILLEVDLSVRPESYYYYMYSFNIPSLKIFYLRNVNK